MASSSGSKKRKVLDLEQRVAVLKKIDGGQSCRKIASKLGVGKTQRKGGKQVNTWIESTPNSGKWSAKR